MAVSNINIIGVSLPIGHAEGQRGHAVSPSIKESSRSEGYNIGLSKDTRDFKEIQAIKARLNEIAGGMRDSPVSNKDILERIKANLNGINKFFPPYPPGSEERVRLLKSYAAFRLLIERLTIPPDVMDMTEAKASEKSISIKDSIAQEDKAIATNSENMQSLF